MSEAINPQAQDFAQDMESSSQIGGSGAATDGKKERKFDKGFTRNIKVIGIVVGAALLLFLLAAGRFLFGGNDNSHLTASVSSGANLQAQSSDNTSPKLQEMHLERQREEALAAARRGESYIPPDVVNGTMQPIPEADPNQPQPMPTPMPVQSQPVMIAPAGMQTQEQVDRHNMRVEAEVARNALRQAGLARQMEALITSGNITNVRQILVAENEGGNGSGADPNAYGTGAEQERLQTQQTMLFPGLKVAPGQMENVIRVDEGSTGYASARITAGPLAGAFLIGSARVVNADSLDITFTRMSLNDEMYTINAKVLDDNTANQAIRGNVDHRVMSRYVMPILMAATQGYYQAKSETGTTIVNLGTAAAVDGITDPIAGSTLGMAGVHQPSPTTEQARSAGISKGLEIAQDRVDNASNRPINVSQERGFPVGIMFMEPVYANPPSGR